MSTYKPPLENVVTFCDTLFSSKTDNTGEYVELVGNQVISGLKSFSIPPVSSINPSSGNQLANKSFVDGITANQVTTDTAQTISAVKTITANIETNNMRFVNTGNTDGTSGVTFNKFCSPIWTMAGRFRGSGNNISITYGANTIIGRHLGPNGFGCEATGSLHPAYINNGSNIPAESNSQFTSSGTFEIRVKGTYQIQVALFLTSASNARFFLNMYKGGSVTALFLKGDNYTYNPQGFFTVQLDVGDSIWLSAGYNLTMYLEGSGGTYHSWMTVTRYIG